MDPIDFDRAYQEDDEHERELLGRIAELETKYRKLEIAIMNARADLGRILEDLQKATQS